jgi:hypothetical protein
MFIIADFVFESDWIGAEMRQIGTIGHRGCMTEFM